jgi:hypothetical protein
LSRGAVAISGVITATVGGLAWMAVFADPLIAGWLLMLAAKTGPITSRELGANPRIKSE